MAKLGPHHKRAAGAEVQFDKKLTYPYKFTCALGNENMGDEGEGNFSLQVYSKDMNMDVVKLR